MIKLRLVLDDLQVQSFATTSKDPLLRGTIHAQSVATDAVECPSEWNTCFETCGTCRYSNRCNGTDPGDYSVDCTRGGLADTMC